MTLKNIISGGINGLFMAAVLISSNSAEAQESPNRITFHFFPDENTVVCERKDGKAVFEGGDTPTLTITNTYGEDLFYGFNARSADEYGQMANNFCAYGFTSAISSEINDPLEKTYSCIGRKGTAATVRDNGGIGYMQYNVMDETKYASGTFEQMRTSAESICAPGV